MVLKSKHFQTSQLNISTLKYSSHMLLHQTYIQAKEKDKKHLQQPIHFWTSLMLSSSKVPTPQNPLRNFKAIKSLGTSLA
jgi:hypothetical protein